MRHVVTLLLALLIIGVEASLWWFNPMHIPQNFYLARAMGLQQFRAQGAAMEPGVRAGQSVLVSSWPYLLHEPKAGDVVAFVYPSDPFTADLKRIAAVGGSTILIRNGVVYVDGVKREEPYLHALEGRLPLSISAVKVPPGTYFVLGDNRDESEDSRSYGVIPRAAIIGKEWF